MSPALSLPHRTASRSSRFWRIGALAVLTLLAIGAGSCATTPAVEPSSEPVANSATYAARAGLRPEYRVFYDALVDYGDWVLIEPYGWVFRPRVGYDTWNPYWDGFWTPTDAYGWVWVSGEPFGWATYHYGRWLRDDYQGWVWVPGVDWAPAWVAWNTTNNYVGWAPLSPGSSWTSANLSTSAPFQYVPASALGSTNIKAQVLSAKDVPAGPEAPRLVTNLAHADGVTINRGPRIDWVESQAGPLPRTKIEDLVASETPTAIRARMKAEPPPSMPATETPETPARAAANRASAQARALMDQHRPLPQTLTVVRPINGREAPAAPPTKSRAPAPTKSSAPRDTTR
jgi:hypothetical protein